MVAERITDEIQARCDSLTNFPRMGPVVMGNIRKWSMPNIGYIVTYVVEGGNIRIVRVYHGREDRKIP